MSEAASEFQKAKQSTKRQRLRRAKQGTRAVAYPKTAGCRPGFTEERGVLTQHQYIDAYEVLAVLPKGSHALVADNLQALETNYIKEALEKPKRCRWRILLSAAAPTKWAYYAPTTYCRVRTVSRKTTNN